MIDRVGGKDRLTIRLAVAPGTSVIDFEQEFLKQRVMFKESVEKGLIAPLKVEGVRFESLQKNPRTGKLRLVIDQRFGP